MTNKDEGRKSGLVHVRDGFSDVSGISPCNNTIQLEEFDDITRTRISNKVYELLEMVFDNISDFYYSSIYRFHHDVAPNGFCRAVLNDVFCEKINLPYGRTYSWNNIFESKISEVIKNATFNEVLDVVEYVCRWLSFSVEMNKEIMFSMFNELFEKECMGYRFVNERIVAISDNTEIAAIEEACHNPYEGCRVQLQKALDFLADRENRDYKNSIKESISAVESLCRVIVKNERAVLSTALNQLEKNGLVIHPAMKLAFTKLYSFTSDQGGIRHAERMFESDVTFEEAKFMLVSCSAFINYLTAEMAKGGN